MAFIKSRKHAVNRRQSLGAATAATLLTSFALAHPALAADTGTTAQVSDTKNLPGVKVEANRGADYHVDKVSSPKFTQPLLDTPQTISVISKDLIQDQGATTLTEALRNSPGVGTFYVGENGSTSTGDAVYMRGFDASSSIFVDGVRDMGSISRDVFNIEQVEVEKGPAGTDNGRTSAGGAINLVSKQPQLMNAVSGSVSYGNANRKRATADWNQAIGEHSAFRLNVLGQKAGVAGRNDVENNRWGVAPSLAFGLGTPTRLYIDLLHVKQNNVPDGGVATIGLPSYRSPDPTRPWLNGAPRADQDKFYGTDADHDHVKADMATVRVEHDFANGAVLRNTTRWGKTHQDYLLTSFMYSAANLVTPDPADPSTWTVARSNPTFKDNTNKIVTNQTNFTTSFHTGSVEHSLSTGIELTQEKLSTVGVAALNGSKWTPASVYHPNPDSATGLVWGRNGTGSEGKTTTEAAYAFDTLKFGEQWLVTGGVRLDHYKTEFDSTVACGGRGAPACGASPTGTVVPGVDATKSDNLLNWKIGVVYKPAANGSVYADYAVSAQPPGGAQLQLSSSANSADNPAFDPQKARTAELGTKWNLFGDDLLLTAAVYRTEVSNDIAQGDDGLYYQTGKKRVSGVELSAVGKLSDRWSVSSGFTTMDTKVIRGTVVSQDGSSDLAYTPKYAFTAWTTYQLPFGLTIGGGARYAGEMKRGKDGAVGTPDYTKSYMVFDAMATYAVNKHFDLQLNVYNLADKKYVSAINKSGYRYTPGTPRSALLTANFRF
ncbi:catecholate siderophore receptor Fiu [Frateuria sp. Soil773]|uniref:catecholate siderophore receptor Fiu n=1 Tax=Frateuria sp. Soil773 TaxID=1736407 RepID=UPI0007001CE7|nr:catecholate siderophore receptor Fiu [Frateuria sp. Soil773]KRE88400.1 catecholate siderophore receptor Fiu [Frateuria sp. Soil773]